MRAAAAITTIAAPGTLRTAATEPANVHKNIARVMYYFFSVHLLSASALEFRNIREHAMRSRV